MNAWLEMALIGAGCLAVVLVLRWAIRKAAFRYMKFDVPARGQTYVYTREQFLDPLGRPVTDPDLLEELREAWRQIELDTAHDVAAIHAGRNLT